MLRKELLAIQAVLWFILANSESLAHPQGWGDDLANLAGCVCLAMTIDFKGMWQRTKALVAK